MFYLIQKNTFQYENYHKLIETLERLNLAYEVIDCKPFIEEVEFNIDRKDIFVFGSVKLARLAKKYNFYPGSFYGGNHDFSIHSKYYGDNMLNYDSKIIKYTDYLDWQLNEVKFIRPCKDSKLFNGKLFTKVKWEDMKLQSGLNIPDDSLIQIASPKAIYKEVRLWIVGDKIVTSSYYFFHSNVVWLDGVEPEALEFGQQMVDLYKVAPAFVMDVCQTPDGWKIVEINCINSSGFYKVDIQKLLIALENKFN